MSAVNSRDAHMRENRKRKRLEKGTSNFINLPKRTKLNAERQREYRETHKKSLSPECMRNYRKRKARENKTPEASTSIDPTQNPIIYN
jgi:hypothetical protein